MTEKYICDVCEDFIEVGDKFYSFDISTEYATGYCTSEKLISVDESEVNRPFHIHKECGKGLIRRFRNLVFDND